MRGKDKLDHGLASLVYVVGNRRAGIKHGEGWRLTTKIVLQPDTHTLVYTQLTYTNTHNSHTWTHTHQCFLFLLTVYDLRNVRSKDIKEREDGEFILVWNIQPCHGPGIKLQKPSISLDQASPEAEISLSISQRRKQLSEWWKPGACLCTFPYLEPHDFRQQSILKLKAQFPLPKGRPMILPVFYD